MKNLVLTFIGLLSIGFISAQTRTVTFTADDATMIANPERGFCGMVYPSWTSPPTPTRALTQADCDRVKSKMYTVIGMRYCLWPWRNADLPGWFLDQIKNDGDLARKNGLKLWVSFSYIYATNSENAYYDGQSDALVNWILRHIDQLTTNVGANNGPLLLNNDVIAFWSLGFIGSWGEEHHTTNNLLQPTVSYPVFNNNTHSIWNALLAKIPTDRHIATRYPAFKKEKFSSAVLIAPTTDWIGRIGIHDDSFSANIDDYGTFQFYSHLGSRVDDLRAYWANESKYTVSYGETYGTGDAKKQEDGNTVISEMKTFHTDFYNGEHDQTSSYAVTLDKWATQGLLDTMKNFVGYRLHVVSASVPSSLAPSASGTLNFRIENRGWGKIFNPRPVKLLLCRKSDTGYAEQYIIETSVNPRLWYAQSQKDESIAFAIPCTAPAGNYDLFLQLPDGYPTLQNKPAYSIRFATKNNGVDVWNASLGANWMGNLSVGNTASGHFE